MKFEFVESSPGEWWWIVLAFIAFLFGPVVAFLLGVVVGMYYLGLFDKRNWKNGE